MNYDQINGDWRYFKEKFHEKWETIDENELDAFEGSEDILISLVTKLQEEYGISVSQAKKQLDIFLNAENTEDNEDYDIGGSG